MTLREYLQINDGWFPDIMEHLQYRYFLEGYMWKIEPIEKQTVQRVPFDMFVEGIFRIDMANHFPDTSFSFNDIANVIDSYILRNYRKEEK